jgi:hypothetical protein
MNRNVLLSLTATAIGLSIALGLAEAALRVAGKAPELLYAPNPWFGWSHQPGATYVRETEGRKVAVAINDLGFRDRPFTLEKPADTFRILVLGDSFIEALQVPLEQTFAKQLEQRLAARGAHGCAVQVINSGVSAFGTDNALLFYRHEARRLAPDLVVLGFYVGNDVRNNWAELENVDAGGARKPHFVLRDGKALAADYPFEAHASWTVPLKMFVNQHVWSYGLLRELTARWQRAGADQVRGLPLDYQLYEKDAAAVWATAWQVTDALIAELAREVRADAAQLFVMLIPAHEQVEPQRFERAVRAAGRGQPGAWNLEGPTQRLGSMLGARRIPHLDLLPDFRAAAGEGARLYLEVDSHWTADGHARAADRVAEALAADRAVRCREEGSA